VTVPPERALRLALVGWGLGDLAMGRRRAAIAWLAAEVVAIAILAAATILLADTTWYLVPYLGGVAFLVAWAAKAVATFRRARALQGAAPTAQPRSPAATIAWLALPLLLWGTGFWLIAAERATPAAVLDRFLATVADVEAEPMPSHDRSAMEHAAFAALDALQGMCDAGRLADDCADARVNLLRDVRITIVRDSGSEASAEVALVEFQRQPTKVFGIFDGSESVPVPVRSVLRVGLEAQPAALGSRAWAIVSVLILDSETPAGG
jgi:hypothetical protein